MIIHAPPGGPKPGRKEVKTMKVTFTAEAKRFITLSEMPTVRQMIESLKEDESTVNEYAEMAARAAMDGYVVKVFEASAKIAKNSRAKDNYTADSGDLDVWVDFTALTSEGFVIGGAYLTDIWDITGDNDEEIRGHMFLRKFVETK